MNFKINREKFLENLQIISHGLPKASPMKVLECIKIIVDEQRLLLTTISEEISVEVTIANNLYLLKEAGRTIVPGRVLIDLIKAFDSLDVELLIIEDRTLMLKADRKEYRINIMEYNDFPLVEFKTDDNFYKININVLKEAIYQTSFACSSSINNSMLQGVNIKAKDNILYFTATNSYRLSQKVIKLQENSNFDITIPKRSLDELTKTLEIFEDNESVFIYISKNKVLFKFAHVYFQTRILEGNYPDTSNVIPRNCPINVVFNKQELLTCLNRVSLLSPADKESDKEVTYNAIGLKISKTNEVEIYSNNNKGAGKESIVPLDLELNEPLQIGFSSKYLIEALRVISSDNVLLSFVSNIKQFTIKAEKDDSLTELILPFRLED